MATSLQQPLAASSASPPALRVGWQLMRGQLPGASSSSQTLKQAACFSDSPEPSGPALHCTSSSAERAGHAAEPGRSYPLPSSTPMQPVVASPVSASAAAGPELQGPTDIHGARTAPCQQAAAGHFRPDDRPCMGIRVIWVAQHARRAGLATQLLDAVRYGLLRILLLRPSPRFHSAVAGDGLLEHTLMQQSAAYSCFKHLCDDHVYDGSPGLGCRHTWMQGCVMAKSQLAYSHPTEQGLQLFAAYSGTDQIQVYSM